MDAERGPRGYTGSLTLMIRPTLVAQDRSGVSAQRGRQAHISKQTRAAVAETMGRHSNEQSESASSPDPN